ncbi:protein-glutamine gamma-glutamyltransferase E-like [Eublepharis macularius]|uniref:protein-glutamine gamma-glutamyltransferase n=1 Tax=Eublepharis macularius TaxID=481883 RepID=A0AA97LB53_EUBMA|nr:protein-glutamine gamma-glutamyltransferase E-like [Eublepharis macularius]
MVSTGQGTGTAKAESVCSGSCLSFSPHFLTAETLANVDWKWDENTVAHHTDRYNTKELVVRRGQPFVLTLTFHGTKPLGSNLTLIAETGAKPDLQAKTRVAFAVSSIPCSGSWGAVQTAADAMSVSVSISSPPTAIIGCYRLSVTTGSGSTMPATSLGTMVLLFNPWLKGDDVFMPNDAEREEYVLSEFGLVFSGSADHISNFGWDYGQFQEDILNICLTLLDRSRICKQDPQSDLARRNDPKHVSRVLSAMVNCNDDSGVLWGKWKNLNKGKHPSSWMGSVDILRKWKVSEFQAVKFGQCWVFAGVLTTVLRCLGIPTRMISNFSSAHDKDRTLTVDEYFDASGNPLTTETKDSVWNYHVWNESWFVRPDLGSAYDGWQILDATPQERSTGIFQCGPASLTAIKEGDVHLNYDTAFVFAEVNADQISWEKDPLTGKFKRHKVDTKSIGQFTVTKAVGSNTQMDVTNNYKYAEGSAKERAVFEKAHSKLNLNTMRSTAVNRVPTPKPNISGKFKVQRTHEVGKDVHLALMLTNLASEPKTLEAHMTAWTIVYTGKPIHEVWKNEQSVTLGPKEEKIFPIKIPYEKYQQYLMTDNMIRTTALCRVEKEGDILVERVITLENPSLTIKVLGQVKVNEEVRVEVVFTNPLDQEVKDCVLLAEGSDLLVDKIKLDAPPVQAKKQGTIQFALTPSKVGTKQLLVNFSCDRFQNIKAFESMDVAQ